jgi:3-hydroxyisobutyrate dehydrogenase
MTAEPSQGAGLSSAFLIVLGGVRPVDVGFIGLGNQGLPMAQMIERAGWPLTVWARRPEGTAAFADTTARRVASLRELAAVSDVVGVCVRNDDDVREVVLGPHGLGAGLRPDSILLVHSTVLPETCVEVSEALAPRGVSVLDAPVSGSGFGALHGTLTVMVGGDRAAFERVEPIFESYGAGFWLGPLGSGQTMKLLNNALFMANLLMAYEAADAANALGLDAHVAEQVIARSSGASYAIGAAARFRELDSLARPRETLAKDLRNFVELSSRHRAGHRFGELGDAVLDHLAALDGEGDDAMGAT